MAASPLVNAHAPLSGQYRPEYSNKFENGGPNMGAATSGSYRRFDVPLNLARLFCENRSASSGCLQFRHRPSEARMRENGSLAVLLRSAQFEEHQTPDDPTNCLCEEVALGRLKGSPRSV